jgi:hypothetical protein
LQSFLTDADPPCLREFRLIYIDQFVSAFGSAMTYVVLDLAKGMCCKNGARESDRLLTDAQTAASPV